MPSYSFGPFLVRHPQRTNLSHLSEPQKSNLLIQCLVFNSSNFLSILHKPLPVRDVTRAPSPVSSRTIVTSLSDTFVCPHAHLHRCLHLTNPCAELKGSQPN